MFGGVRQRGDQAGVFPRLDHEIGGAALHRLDRQVDVAVGGDQHHGGLWVEPQDLAEPAQALGAFVGADGEVHVEQDRVEAPLTNK